MSESTVIHVAVGVLVNDNREVLVSRRHADSHQGGLWEFPGGKLEAGESLAEGLRREFLEEVGIHIHQAFPLRRISHDYGDKSVLLDVCRIQGYDGRPQGLEGQPVEWRPVAQLRAEEFPAANAPIIAVLQLPEHMAITPPAADWPSLERILRSLLERDIELIQLRQKTLPGDVYLDWYQRALKLCRDKAVHLLFNHDTAPLPESGVSGLHVSARRLGDLGSRPVARECLFSASCHNEAELKRAERLGVDFATLSPVLPTPKYAGSQVLGWPRFSQLRQTVSIPVYALGGMTISARKTAREHGADGIAGIRLYLAGE